MYFVSMADNHNGKWIFPASLYGRLLNRADLESMGAVAHFLVDDEGKVERLPLPS